VLRPQMPWARERETAHIADDPSRIDLRNNELKCLESFPMHPPV